ncbi:MAG: tetratricopeptide repeat protein [Alphaproteobacteria bacterium]|nr:tetratricopeptide repeat protein [Alphaproteobacteria bacterium]
MLPLFFLLCLGVPEALAQEPPSEAEMEQAKELFKSGRTLYEEGRYEEAIVDWEQSYRLSGQPVLLFNIGNAYERLGDYDKAIAALTGYAETTSGDERKSIERRIESLTERRDELAAQAAPPDPTPLPDPTPVPDPTPATVEPSRPPIAPIALMGVGVAGLGTGVAFGLGARGARADADALCVNGLCPDTAAEAIATDRRSSVLADVGFIVGGVGLASGATLFLLSGRTSADDLSLSVSPGALLLSGSF